MTLTNDETLVIIGYYEDIIGRIDRRIDDIENSEASALLDPDIIRKQIDRLIEDRKINKRRLEKFKSVATI